MHELRGGHVFVGDGRELSGLYRLRSRHVLDDGGSVVVVELFVMRCGDVLVDDGCLIVDRVLILRHRYLPGERRCNELRRLHHGPVPVWHRSVELHELRGGVLLGVDECFVVEHVYRLRGGFLLGLDWGIGVDIVF